jgi:Tfp pilus assembly protein PilV
MNVSSSKGFSLAETVIAIGILTTGVLGAAGVLAAGMQNLSSSPADVVVTQKAAQAVEAVFSARDSHRLTWAQIKNVHGASGSDGGIFLDGPQPLNLAGADGLVNTADDTTSTASCAEVCWGLETVKLPGKDQMLGTSDDTTITLTQFTREILIRDVSNENGELRSIVVTIKYQNGPTVRTYTLTTFISAYS